MMKLILSVVGLTLTLAGTAFAQQGNPGAHFVHYFDQNGDGAVTLEEAQTLRDNLFTTFDSDSNGTLSPEEVDAFDEMRAAD